VNPKIEISLPEWTDRFLETEQTFASTEDRMQFAIELARQNILQRTGGPFGAAVFESETGRLVSIGVNLVVPQNNCVLHAEIIAFMMAQHRLESWTLAAPGMPAYEIVTSCEPCAMCLGATHWSGVERLVCGAAREDAERLNFDEGPVFAESYAYLQRRGVEIVRRVCREEARAVLELYAQQSGTIYNG